MPNGDQIDCLDDIEFIGANLRRPECVLCAANGVVHASNRDGGISRIHADGRFEHLLGEHPQAGGPIENSAADYLRNLEVVEAICASDLSGQRIVLD